MSQAFRDPAARWGLGLLLLTCLAYIPALSAEFIWDDDDYVTANPVLQEGGRGLVRIWTEPTSLPQWYPLVHTTFWLEAQLWGMSPAGYHIVNVLLHGLSAWVLLIVLRRLEVPGALLAAAVFAVHPVHVESVAWVTERKNVLSLLFALLAVRAWLVWRPLGGDAEDAPRGRFYPVCCSSCAPCGRRR